MWRLRYDPEHSVLHVQLLDVISPRAVHDLAAAQFEALSEIHEPFRVLIDLRGLFPLEAESVEAFSTLKKALAAKEGFERLAVLADSATVAMQQHHTRIGKRELVSTDTGAVERFLAGSDS